jgi:hypothetical protein
VAANPRVRSEMSGSEEKLMALITMLERGVPLKVRCLYYLMEVHKYRWGEPIRTLVRVAYADTVGQTARDGALGETLIAYRCHHGGPLMDRVKPHVGGGSESMYL